MNKEEVTTLTLQEESQHHQEMGNGEFSPIGGALASLRGVPKYLNLRVQGFILNQRVSMLIDSGATHNFIDAQLVQRRVIPTDAF